VYRHGGLHEGAPLQVPLLSDAMLIERGRAVMDAQAQGCNRLDAAVVFRPGVRLGQLVEAIDPATAQPLRAKVIGMQITVGEAALALQLTLEQPR